MRQAAEFAAVAHFLLSVLTGVSGHVRSAAAWLVGGEGVMWLSPEALSRMRWQGISPSFSLLPLVCGQR